MPATEQPKPKPWWKRTEFWLSLLGQVVGIYTTVKPSSPWGSVAGAILAAGSGGTYAVSRGLSKSGTGN